MTSNELIARAAEWSARIGVQPKEIRIAPPRKKWGECTVDGVITLAGDLLDCNEDAWIDFVVCHEILHLRIRNHGRLFKVFMSLYLPGWEKMIGPGMQAKID